MKKLLMFVGAFLIVGLFFTAINLLFNRGTWECVNGEWVKRGNPLGAPPIGGCGSSIGEDFGLPITGESDSFNGQISDSSRDQLTVKVGQDFPIILEGTPEGSKWQVDFDANYLVLVNETSGVEGGLEGAGDQQVFVFKPKIAGSTILNFTINGVGTGSAGQIAKVYIVRIE